MLGIFLEAFILYRFWRFFTSAILLVVATLAFRQPGGSPGLGVLAIIGIGVVIGTAFVRNSDQGKGSEHTDTGRSMMSKNKGDSSSSPRKAGDRGF